ncbi:MAG TPA: AAA family ATPase [Terriglobia bacterium]|nr:AAA family ATPase [Terriglobia bacterium]
MKSIALFNNKGGVGKTTLVYHLAYMLSRLGYPTLAVDLDPQANLTSAFLDEQALENLWETKDLTILGCVRPILEGIGDIREATPRSMADGLWLIPGDLGLSRFEDKLSSSWPGGYSNDPAALRATSAFHRIVRAAAELVGAVVALIDVGPNLGAINRAALLAADYLVIPLAADLFSLQGLENLGPTVIEWRKQWNQIRNMVSVNFELPGGLMAPAGYVVLQHAVRLDRPTKAYAKWLNRIPTVYREVVLGETPSDRSAEGMVNHCLATIRNYRSLMPMAQDARKPIFDLTYADGAIGSHAQLVKTCADEFRALAKRVAEACRIEAPARAGSRF